MAEATEAAFGDLALLLAEFDTTHGDHDTARAALVDFYLSTEHRDQRGTGCRIAGFAGDMAREPTAGEVRETYAAGVREFAAWMSADADDGLPMVAALVGAILLARATAGTELSEKILASTHTALTAPHGPRPGIPGTGAARRGPDAT
ncbi:TetR/AcrR family transcriptional regulator [Streptomyces sp. MBT65]|uniref:TetR/AcrR family transcriptional regulator n=1 Tax=Streptomyces sp. MBT65 TaxID=1488395 RepID=UPI0027DA4023|nr:TetR/AcrR family transcriptional regulator [Streptomyces sp. MBT65]